MCRVRDHARSLIDDDDRFVFVYDVKRNRLCRRWFDRFWRSDIIVDDIADFKRSARLGQCSVAQNQPVLDGLRDGGT